MEWLINRRRMMFNKSTPVYLNFEDHIIWATMCERYGDYDEVVITDNGDDTVDIVTTYKSMRNGSIAKSVVIDTQTNVDNTGGTYTPGTTKTMLGISKKQCAAVTSFPNQLFKSNNDIVSFNELSYFTNLHNISYSCFDGCSNFESIDLSNISTIDGYGFRDCSKLKATSTIKITQAGTNCLNGTAIESIDLSDLTSYSSTFLTNCSSLKTVLIGSSMTTFLSNMFSGCSSLEDINIPDTMTSFGTNAFTACNKIKVYKLPNSLVTLSAKCFANCPDLLYIGAINTSLTTYGEDQVRKGSGNPKLVGVTLPSTVTSVGLANYGNTPKFLRIYATSVPTATNTTSGASAGTGIFENIYVPDTAVNDYKAASVWSIYASRIYPISQWATDAQTYGWQDVQSGLVWDREE